jgi:hypothetical protein
LLFTRFTTFGLFLVEALATLRGLGSTFSGALLLCGIKLRFWLGEFDIDFSGSELLLMTFFNGGFTFIL